MEETAPPRPPDASGTSPAPGVSGAERLLQAAYAAFNARDIDAALALMHPDVAWPNGMEGGIVQGHRAVREYWTRQWRVIDPHVEPRRFSAEPSGGMVVDVHQVVRDLEGILVKDQMVQHAYRIEGGLITAMEIRPWPGAARDCEPP